MKENTKALKISKDDLLKKMSGELTTSAWDVLCCYSEGKINELLAQKYKSGKLVTEVPFDCSYYDDIFEEHVSIVGNLKLKEK